MGESNRRIRERLLDRIVMRYVLLLLLIAFICPVLNSQFLTPYVDIVPLYPNRPACSDLPAPFGGNQRSLIAYKSDQSNAVDLDLALSKERYTFGESLEVTVTFINEDKAPINLHLPPGPGYLITNSATAQGVIFEIAINNNPIGQPGADYQPPATFAASTLHVLGPRTNCQQVYQLDWTNLQLIGMNLGDYTIRAYYRNNQPGSEPYIPNFNATPPEPTAIPEYLNAQGAWNQDVWTGSASSNRESFSIVNPPPVQPAAPES